MNDLIQKFIDLVNEYNVNGNNIILKENELLSKHSTFKIGGPAKLFCIPSSASALIFLLETARRLSLRTFVLGNGSNVLFDDAGFDGVIISTSALNSVEFDGNVLSAECGAMLSSCAIKARDHKLSGLEKLFGIPGTVGGAVFMNAGAYGGEISQVAVKTTYIDPETFEIKTVCGEEHEFGYRHSIFKKNNGIILKTFMELVPSDIDAITSVMDECKAKRVEKQPLEYPSAGSTFKRYPGRYTGQMIDECGLKGRTVGGAQVSEKHAGFVINKGSATSADVLELIDIIKTTIKNAYGIEIQTEVIYVK